MLEFLRKNEPTQLNNDAPASQKKELGRMRKRIGVQAALAVMTVVLTVVIVFGMTAAWYTNVVQSSGLIFEVEKLGVNVDAVVNATTITAKPGDSGLISLEATNGGNTTVNITVTVNKASMDAQMQKRLYFYVESQQVDNGETAQRTYLTTTDGFTYTVFSKDSLTLTEAYYNDAQLEWCWVYDVLGYYVQGSLSGHTVTVEEYLRPIEYDYDSATFDSDGNLLTVDGTTTVNEFLTALSATDGYAGTIEPDTVVDGYYPVAVDGSGYGVYAYLCTRDEVEANTDYDTALGAAASADNPATYTARLTVNAQNSALKTVTVTTVDDLRMLLADSSVEAIKLGGDIAITANTNLTIAGDRDVLIDLNGHTLTTNVSGTAVTVETGSSLTMTNGRLIGGNPNGTAFSVSGADVTLSDVNLGGYFRGFWVTDNLGGGQDSTVRLTGCTFNTTECAVLIYGNGLASEQTSKLIVENCRMYSEDIVICGNGTSTGEGRWGTDIQIIGSTIVQQDAEVNPLHAPAIYHPQKEGTLNIYNSTIQGYGGIAIKGGTVAVTESDIIATATADFEEPKANNSGASNTGDAIYVETGYGYDIILSVTDSTVTSYYREAVRIYESNTPYVTYMESGCTLTSYSKIVPEEETA